MSSEASFFAEFGSISIRPNGKHGVPNAARNLLIIENTAFLARKITSHSQV